MKSKKTLILLGAALVSLCLSGCNFSPTNSGTDTNEFTVTFDSQGGTGVAAVKVKKGETVTKPEDPTKEGVDFVGWYQETSLINKFDFSTPITRDWTLYAGWKNVEYTITFDSQGGSAVSPIKVKKDETATAPTSPTKKFYSFTGWYTEQALTTLFDFSTPITRDWTLYAGWQETPRNLSLKTAVFADIQLCAKENGDGYYGNAGNTVHAYIALKNHFQLCKEQNVDVIFMNGDIVNNAIPAYYDLYEDALQSVYGTDETTYPEIIYNMGNHEWWDLKETVTENAVSLFKQHARIGDVVRQTSVTYSLDTAETLPTYYKVVKGIPFLVISGEDPSGRIGTTMKSEIQSWLTEMSQLQSVRDGGPIYVAYHCALHTTLTHGNGAFEESLVLEDLLKNYPQAVVFTGDTHYSGVNERAINQVNFTAINIGSSSYSRMDKMSATMTGSEHFYNMKIKGGKTSDELLGDANYMHEYTPTIHMMKTYDNLDTTIDRYFSTDNKEQPIHINQTWDLPRGTNKTNFKYTNSRFNNVQSANALYGANGVSWSNLASVRFGVNNGKMTVIIPDTLEYHYTEHYKIEVTGNTTKTYDVVNNYYKYNAEPGNMYFFLEDLPVGDSYSIKVTAYDYFDNPSLNYLTSSTNDLTVCADEKDNAFTNTYFELSNHLRFDEHAPGSSTSIEYYYEGVKKNEYGAPLGQLIRDTVPGETDGGNNISEYLSIGNTENCEIILRAKIKNLSNHSLKFGYQLRVAGYTYKNAEGLTMKTKPTVVPANSDWVSLQWNVTDSFPEAVGRSGVTFLSIIVSADGYAYDANGYEMHFLLDDMDVVAGEEVGTKEAATRYNLEMCQFSPGQWRAEGSEAKVSYTDTYGPTSTSSRKITFSNSNGLPDTNTPSSTATVNASFDLAQTSGLGTTTNDIDAKNCTLTFDIKMSEEFFTSNNNSRCKFTCKIEDQTWAAKSAWLNLVNSVPDFDYDKTDNGWLHVSCDLSTVSNYSELQDKTYVITFGFFGICNANRSSAYIVMDNIALTANS